MDVPGKKSSRTLARRSPKNGQRLSILREMPALHRNRPVSWNHESIPKSLDLGLPLGGLLPCWGGEVSAGAKSGPAELQWQGVLARLVVRWPIHPTCAWTLGTWASSNPGFNPSKDEPVPSVWQDFNAAFRFSINGVADSVVLRQSFPITSPGTLQITGRSENRHERSNRAMNLLGRKSILSHAMDIGPKVVDWNGTPRYVIVQPDLHRNH